MLKNIKNIIFDLDNTLHDYSYTSSMALDSLFKEINKYYNVDTLKLKEKYSEIVKIVEVHAFMDGRTSHEHRRERFDKLLKYFNIQHREDEMQHFLNLYENELKSNLKPCTDLHDTLEKLSKKRKLYLATEGPEDAQLRVIEWLGIKQLFNQVFTSNKSKMRKADGSLFLYILESTGSKPEETIVIGDSYKSDILGAKNAGLKSIWIYSEDVTGETQIRINEIQELRKYLD